MKNEISAYSGLLKDLKNILQTGQAQALKQLQETRAQTYWQMGKRLSQTPEVKQQKNIPPVWVERFLRDLGLSKSHLYRILKFYQTYPKGLPKTHQKNPLSWGAHVALLPLQDEVERNFYLQKAVEQSWTVQQLKDALKQNLYQNSLLPSGKTNKKGKTKLKRPTTGLYLYTAVIERVVDGDTLIASIDLGFDVWKKQRLRLKAIDCPELKTKEGLAAKAFVEETLAPLEVVILKTYKMDLHGRFVTDVFFKQGETNQDKVFESGTFLNELIVQAKHATIVS